MKKKILNLLILAALVIGVFASNNIQVVSASSTTIASTVTIDEGQGVDNITTYTEDIVITLTSGDVFVVNSGATLVLEGLEITASGSVSLTNIFNVKSGGKLILRDVVIDSTVIASKGIYNRGEVELYGTTSFSSNVETSIYNNSSIENSLKLYSASLQKVHLETGYITIFDETVISKTVEVVCDGEYEGKVVVKGNEANVFASKLIGKFQYISVRNSTEYYLDYVGDNCTLEANLDGEIASQGDIIITTNTLKIGGTTALAKNCTASAFIAKNAKAGKFPIYKCNQTSQYLNNYTSNGASATYTVLSEYANYCPVTLTVNTYKESDMSNAISSTTYKYPAGSNYAVFVDIPTGYQLDTATVDNNVFAVSENKYANACYMRPIIQYASTTIDAAECSVDFVFKEIEQDASLSVIKADNVVLNGSNEEMVVGGSYTFTLPFSDDYKILNVKFNDEDVQLTQDANGYTFTLIMSETNTLNITSVDLPYDVVVTPPTFSFTYGDEIDLTQEYTVEATHEIITLTYSGEIGSNAGTYKITNVTCDNPDYNVTLASGDYYYTINQKTVDVSGVTISPYEAIYSDNFELSAEMFVANLPNGIQATATLVDSILVAGEQDVLIRLSVNNGNYTIVNGQQVEYETKLTIRPITLDTSACEINNLSVVYDGYPKELTVSGLTDLIAVNFTYYSIGENDTLTPVASATNAGSYLVRAQLYSTSTFYTTDTCLEGNITISKCLINLDEYKSKVSSFTCDYDRQSHVIDFSLYDQYLPQGVTRGTVENNFGHVNANTYNITINLEFDDSNYDCESSVVSQLIINPLKVVVTLQQSTFPYDGNVPVLTPIVSGCLTGDAVDIEFENFIYSAVGEYDIDYILSNSNYYTETNYITIIISANIIDIASSIHFDDVTCVYDGLVHLPVVSGTLPMGMSYEIDNISCVDVGVYNVKCSFINSNINYVTPDPIYAKVIITPKPIFVEFSLDNNMIANGEKKTVNISFSGVVPGEDVKYNIAYSGACILAGEYVCTVTLKTPSNYTIINTNTYEFIVFAGSASYVSDNLNLTLEGVFHPDSSIVINDTSSNLNIVNAVADMECKSYSSFKISYQNYSTDPVTLKVNNVNSIDAKKLNVYRVVNGQLEKIEYKMSGNVIYFQINGTEELLFIEESSSIMGSIILIGAIAFVSAIAISVLISFILINNKRKKNIK